MKTEIVKIDPNNVDVGAIAAAADILRSGGLVVFPTETVYGLGGDAMNSDAAAKIYAAKGRPSDNPLIAHISSWDEIYSLASFVPDAAKRLADAFWGGPLTMVLKKKDAVPLQTTGGRDTVAVRLPSHSVANALIKAAKTPIAAPSANISGKPSPTTAAHVLHDLDGRVDMIIDGGDSMIGLESTVLDLTQDVPAILRPGAISLEMITEVIGETRYGQITDALAPKSPGMKYTHYSPNAEVFAFTDERCVDASGFKRPCAIVMGESNLDFDILYNAGDTVKDYAARLFYFLRKADEDGADVVFAYLPAPDGIGEAVRNRLLKAAGGRVL